MLPLTGSERTTDLLLMFSYVTLALPYMYRAVDTGLRAIDVHTLTEAAQSLGAGWSTILLRVILPNVRVAVVSGAFLTFAIVIGEFTMASLLDRPAFGPYLQLIGANRAYEPSALAIISFAITWACMGFLQIFARRRSPGRWPGRISDGPRRAVGGGGMTFLEIENLQKQFATHHGGRARPAGGRSRRVRVAAGTERVRQDDDAAHDCRVRVAVVGRDPPRRGGHHAHAAEPAPRRDGVPVLRAVSRT